MGGDVTAVTRHHNYKDGRWSSVTMIHVMIGERHVQGTAHYFELVLPGESDREVVDFNYQDLKLGVFR